jgi:hypothetical protein
MLASPSALAVREEGGDDVLNDTATSVPSGLDVAATKLPAWS